MATLTSTPTCAGTEVPVENNTDAPLYSPFLAEKLNLPGGYLQLGFYISVVTGRAILFNRFYRARALAKYVEAKIAHAPEKQLQHWAFMANVEPWGLEHASQTTRHIKRLRVEGVLAAVGMPLFWTLPWRITTR